MLYTNEPGRDGSVDKRRFGPPTEGVTVFGGSSVDKPSDGFQMLNDFFVRILKFNTIK